MIDGSLELSMCLTDFFGRWMGVCTNTLGNVRKVQGSNVHGTDVYGGGDRTLENSEDFKFK